MQEDAVSLFEEKLSRQASEAVGGTRDEDARHAPGFLDLLLGP